ncbi:MAG: RNA polymerase Rpb4 [Candidatus Bathyarchaeota archaeon]|nr:MAG: RNA polymerase Rpb4 [Candidatus Bathyarchaeota archaeon]
MLTVPEARKLLEAIGEDNLDQFQRRAFDYTAKFAKIDAKLAKNLVKDLVGKLELEEEEAVQIVNCMPESIEELRVFLAGGRKIVETQKLEAILAFLNQHRKKE